MLTINRNFANEIRLMSLGLLTSLMGSLAQKEKGSFFIQSSLKTYDVF